MLVGLVAAGFYICFCGNTRGRVWAGAGVAGLELGSFLFPEIRYAVPLLTALWMMLTEIVWGEGAGFRNKLPAGRREGVFLAGGVWLMARSLAEICTGSALQQLCLQQLCLQQAGLQQLCLQQTSLLRTALAAALFAMAGLYLLGRGRLYPLWMAALGILWLIAGFLGSLAYGEKWQIQVMSVSLYVTAGGILVFQQIFCIRQELESGWRLEKRRELPTVVSEMLPGASREAGAGYGAGENWNVGIEADAGAGTNWREEAGREYRELAIFEHDFRHHLDIVAALYEEGSAEEARSYIEDLKQARESRQGRVTGGERELSYIMMAKRKACRQAEITFSYQIVGTPRGIARMDMTALLLNLLDNAIRACQEAPKPRSIGVMLLSRGELWEIEMVNSGRYEPGGVQHAEQRREARPEEPQRREARREESQQREVRREEPQRREARREEPQQAGPQWEGVADGGMTRKAHGIGMISVRQIVDKYHGICRIWEEDGQVRQKLILVQRNGQNEMSGPESA